MRPKRTGRRRVRQVLAGILVVLTSLCIVAATIGIWTQRTLADTDRFVALVAPLADDPAVTNPLAARLSEEVFLALDVETRIEEALSSIPDLPPQASFLVGPAHGRRAEPRPAEGRGFPCLAGIRRTVGEPQSSGPREGASPPERGLRGTAERRGHRWRGSAQSRLSGRRDHPAVGAGWCRSPRDRCDGAEHPDVARIVRGDRSIELCPRRDATGGTSARSRS